MIVSMIINFFTDDRQPYQNHRQYQSGSYRQESYHESHFESDPRRMLENHHFQYERPRSSHEFRHVPPHLPHHHEGRQLPEDRHWQEGRHLPIDRHRQDLPIDRQRHDLPIVRQRQDLPMDRHREDVPIVRHREDLPIDRHRHDLPIVRQRHDVRQMLIDPPRHEGRQLPDVRQRREGREEQSSRHRQDVRPLEIHRQESSIDRPGRDREARDLPRDRQRPEVRQIPIELQRNDESRIAYDRQIARQTDREMPKDRRIDRHPPVDRPLRREDRPMHVEEYRHLSNDRQSNVRQDRSRVDERNLHRSESNERFGRQVRNDRHNPVEYRRGNDRQFYGDRHNGRSYSEKDRNSDNYHRKEENSRHNKDRHREIDRQVVGQSTHEEANLFDDLYASFIDTKDPKRCQFHQHILSTFFYIYCN